MEGPDDPKQEPRPAAPRREKAPAARAARERSGRGSASALASLRELERAWSWYQPPAGEEPKKR